MKGWGANLGRDLKVRKAGLLFEIQLLDLKVNGVGLSSEEWAIRYNLEDELLKIYCKEETYWRHKLGTFWGRQHGVLPSYCQWKEALMYYSPFMDIRAHVDGFYTQLFSEVARGGTSLAEHV